MCAQEPIDSSQKVDDDEAGEELFKPSFNFGVFREIDKVIDVESNGKGCGRDIVDGIVGVAYAACEHTWVRGIGFEANAGNDRHNLVVTVSGTAAEAIQSFPEELIFVFASVGVSNGWFHDSGFIVGENALTKCIFAVTDGKRHVSGLHDNQENVNS